MDIRIRLETLGIRLRSLLRTGIRLCGLGLLLLGIYNMFLTGLFELTTFAPYRQWGFVFASNDGGYYIGDVLVMAIGACIAWFT